MKIGRVIFGVIFLLIFVAAALMAVDAVRCVGYEDVFPEDINALIWIHQPLDVPLKVLNSSAAKGFFKTTEGKEVQKQLDDMLAALSSKEKKGGPPPEIWMRKLDGIKVYYLDAAKLQGAPATEETPVATPEKKPGALTLEKIEQGLGIGGVVVKDLYIGLYGNPLEGMMSQNKPFMFAMNLGRLSVWPRLFLSKATKPLPNNIKPGEEDAGMGEGAQWIAFAFVRNMLIAGDPKGIERMIHAFKGTPMTVTETSPEMGMATPEQKPKTVTIALKTLKKSPRWAKLKKSLNPKAHFNLALILPNLLDQLKKDPTMKESIEGSAGKFGIARIVGLVHSNQMDMDGIRLTTEVVFEPPTPITALLNHGKREMDWPKLLPQGFQVGAGLTSDNYPAMWDAAMALFPSQVSELGEQIQARFGVDDMKGFLGILGKEISIIQVPGETGSATIHCDQVAAGAKDYFAKLEVTAAEKAIGEAESAIEAAVSGGAETFAPVAIAKAKEALQYAKNSQGEGKRVEAVVLARKATEFADLGLKTILKKAEATIEAAKYTSAFTYAPEEFQAAESSLKEAQESYDAGQPVAGTAAAKKALDMGSLAYALGKAGSLLDSAKTSGADTKAPMEYDAALAAFNAAKTTYKSTTIAAGIAQADTAASIAKTAITASTGGGEDIYVPAVQLPEEPDYSLPTVQSPRAAEGVEIFTSVGTEPIDYAFITETTMCYAPAADLDAFLKLPRGTAVKDTDMVTLQGLMTAQVQGLVLLNVANMLQSAGMLPLEGEIAGFVNSLNLMAGVFIVASDDKITLSTVSPIQLFNGKTTSGARSAAAAFFFLTKWLFYIVGLCCVYFAYRMFTAKKE